MIQMSGFGFWFLTPPKVGLEQKFKYHRNALIEPRPMIYILVGKCQIQD